MDKGAFDGIVLFIGNDDRGAFDAGDFHVENGVMAGLAADDSEDVFGVDADGLRVFESAVDNSGNQAGHARTARFILAAASARLRRDDRI